MPLILIICISKCLHSKYIRKQFPLRMLPIFNLVCFLVMVKIASSWTLGGPCSNDTDCGTVSTNGVCTGGRCFCCSDCILFQKKDKNGTPLKEGYACSRSCEADSDCDQRNNEICFLAQRTCVCKPTYHRIQSPKCVLKLDRLIPEQMCQQKAGFQSIVMFTCDEGFGIPCPTYKNLEGDCQENGNCCYYIPQYHEEL